MRLYSFSNQFLRDRTEILGQAGHRSFLVIDPDSPIHGRVVYRHHGGNTLGEAWSEVNLDKDYSDEWDNSEGRRRISTDSLVPVFPVERADQGWVLIWAGSGPIDVAGVHVRPGWGVTVNALIDELIEVGFEDGATAQIGRDNLPLGVAALPPQYNPTMQAEPSALDYPPGYVREADRVETFEPDVIDRADVERIIRQFASEVGYPSYAQRLIDRLPQPTPAEVTVKVTILGYDEDGALGRVSAALENVGLEFVNLESA